MSNSGRTTSITSAPARQDGPATVFRCLCEFQRIQEKFLDFLFVIFSKFSNCQCFDSITGEASVEMVGTSRFKQHADYYQAHFFLVSWPWPWPSNARIINKTFPVGFLTILLSSGDVSLTMAVSSKYYVYPHNSEQFPTVTVVFITITIIITWPQPAFGWRGLECIVEP